MDRWNRDASPIQGPAFLIPFGTSFSSSVFLKP